MDNQSLDRRLEQIFSSKVPYYIVGGNAYEHKPISLTSPLETSESPSASPRMISHAEPIGLFQGGIVEVVIERNLAINYFFEATQDAAEKLALAGGFERNKGERFIKKPLAPGEKPRYENVEVHAIYDSRSDLTHIFLMPSRDFIEKGTAVIKRN